MLPTIDESSGLWTRTMKNKNNKNKRSINNNTDNDNDNDINGAIETAAGTVASSSSKRQRLILSDSTNANTNNFSNPFVDTSNKTVAVAVSSAVVTTTNNTQSLFLLPTSDEIMKELCKIVAFDDSSDHKRSSYSSSSSSRRKIALKSLLIIRKWIKKSNNNNNNNMNSNSETSSSKNNNNCVINELLELGCIPTLLTFLEKNIQNNDIECISVVVSVIVKLTMTINNNTQQIISLFVKRNGINLLLLANEKICSSDVGTGTGIGIIAAGGSDGDGNGADDYGTTATKLVALKRIWNAIQNIKLSTEILYKQDYDPSILTKIVTAGLDTLEIISTFTIPSVAEERDDAITDIATTDPLVSATTPSLSSSTTSFDVAFTEEMKYDLLSKSLISLTTNDNDGDGIGSGWNRNNNVLFAALKFYEYCFIGNSNNNKKQPINIPLLFNTQYHYEAIIPFALQTITRNSVLANKYGSFEIIEKSIPYLDTNFIQKSSISSIMSQVWEQEQDDNDNDNDNNNNHKHTETDQQQQHKHTTTSYKVGATQKRAQDILKMLHK
ncbi:hypothetical protein FRACYDRAFT_247961 [Fragilariopsis cylindrus CCMP1102]|uniref:Uncharacterized protein n=1 Tax=Fragilariopsis cylindrus CCMP1102 TaxID=635003 RepID=A0A1E7EV68_9STRA|nr:hypothetical protein FRACYDRAFT_247961 [Fragilariopsis cylindrus CCMP1102]|eukprot:OEU09704.1 hypothetical protein FRACYDRAFT_247961 [Fragilariopsis cylindrus CCMP1102]